MESSDNPLAEALKEAKEYVSEMDALLKDPYAGLVQMRKFLTAWNNLVESEVLASLGNVLGKREVDKIEN